MHLIVGLGNPGAKYAAHRHNIGFRVVEALAQTSGADPFRDKFKGLFAEAVLGDQKLILLKPLTYMNLSGEAVQLAMRFFKVPLERVICVHDELDLPFGEVRIKVGGGAAGHNGVRSLISHCGGPDFIRIRFGVGRPQGIPGDRFVLSNFSRQEEDVLSEIVERAQAMISSIVSEGVLEAMNHFHAPQEPS